MQIDLLRYFLLDIFTQLSILGLYLVAVKATKLALISSQWLFLRSHLMYYMDEDNGSHGFVEPKINCTADTKLVTASQQFSKVLPAFKIRFSTLI
jgi:hypothetical protein